jgi:hypothetical protein
MLTLATGTLDLSGARFGAPATVGASPSKLQFPAPTSQDGRQRYSLAPWEADSAPTPRLLTVVEADVTNLTVADLDLSACLFIGAYNLDKLHIDGPLSFAHAPADWRWTRRWTVAEEHRWRARYDRHPAGWYPKELQQPSEDLPKPDHSASKFGDGEPRGDAERVAAVYRQLRKSFEDTNNQPGAADFYYGEMEMRRLASRDDPRRRSENALVTAYWAVSGYGLRASRAFLALFLVLALATILLTSVGFGEIQQTVYVPVYSTVTHQPVAYKQTHISVPGNKPGVRDAAFYTVESATSLLSGPTSVPLTITGKIIEIILRVLGPLLVPLLLGLGLLGLRGRVKR